MRKFRLLLKGRSYCSGFDVPNEDVGDIADDSKLIKQDGGWNSWVEILDDINWIQDGIDIADDY